MNSSVTKKAAAPPEDIAIVGMACIFPGAPDIRTFWQNIVNKVDCVTDPPEDWGGEPWYDPDSNANDRIYCKRGGYLGDLSRFDPLRFGVMPAAVEGSEPEHYLALQVAHSALADAGYPDLPLNRERTDVIIGRGTYINRGYLTLHQHGLIIDQTLRLLKELHPEYTQDELQTLKQQLKDNIPPFNAETTPGLVSSIMSGRIANRLDLNGTNFCVDSACSSSLTSVEIGVQNLLVGKCDAVLAGAVQLSTHHLMLMIFCQLDALSRSTQIRPFDEAADGTLLGEGLGMMLLKRRSDAVRDGNRIYALIKAVGSASDGRGKSVVAPRVEGETLAIRRAYEIAGISPETVGLVEAHGTAMPLGDETEIQALRQVFGRRNSGPPHCALGSVKSMIAHLIPADGIAGLIKTALALYHRTLPPTLHCEKPDPKLQIESTPFYINTETRPWVHGDPSNPRRAGVDAFGFGGINAHAVLEEYAGDQEAGREDYFRNWETELCVFQGKSRQNLLERCRQVQNYLSSIADGSLLDVSYTLNRDLNGSPYCLVIVAESLQDLSKKLEHAVKRLEDPQRTRIQVRSGIYFFEEPLGRQGKLAFVFPGEGSQYVNMLSDLCLHFPVVRSCFDTLDRAFSDKSRNRLPSQVVFPSPDNDAVKEDEAHEKLWHMDYAVDTVLTANRALFRLLRRLEIHPQAVVGHSSGEFLALEAAGSLAIESEHALVEHIVEGHDVIQRIANAENIPASPLVAVGAINPTVVSEFAARYDGKVFVAMDNCPNQVVVCGEEQALGEAIEDLRSQGAICQTLPFNRPYHSKLFESACEPLAQYFKSLNIKPPGVPVYSCMTTEPMPAKPEEIRRLAVEQWARPVKFRETIESMYRDGVRLFLEVGPRANLTGFVKDTLKGKPHLAIASNVHHRSGTTQLQKTVGLIIAHGVPVCLDYLYQYRKPNKLEFGTTDAHEETDRQEKSAPKLSLALPILSLGPQKAGDLQPKHGRTGPQTSDSFQASGAQPALDETADQMGKVAGSIPPRLNGGEFTSGPASMQPQAQTREVMQEYFRTMELFIDTQKQIMQSFFGSGNTAPVEAPSEPRADNKLTASFSDLSTREAAEAAVQSGVEGAITADIGGPAKKDSDLSRDECESAPFSGAFTAMDEDAIQRMLLTCISEKTGYPTDMLEPEHNLEADLGIDSIKRVEILGNVIQKIGIPDDDVTERANTVKTIKEIVEILAGNCRQTQSDHPGRTISSPPETPDLPPGDEGFKYSEALGDLPFTGNVVELIPGEAVTALRKVNLEDDLFLQHHTLGGAISKYDDSLLALPVFPFAMSLEMMAETAAQLVPGAQLLKIRNVKAHHWIVFEEPGITLQIRARVRRGSAGTIDAQLWITKNGNLSVQDVLAMEATLNYGDSYAQADEAAEIVLNNEVAPSLTRDRFYPQAMFHGPSFQSIKALKRFADNGAEALVEIPTDETLFRSHSRCQFLSDPILLDAAGQIIGMWTASYLDTDFVVFPVGIEEVQFHNPPVKPSATVTCRVQTALEGDAHVRSSVQALKADGTPQILVKDLKHKRIKMPEIFHSFRGSHDIVLSTPWASPAEMLKNKNKLSCCRLDRIPMEFWELDGRIWRTMLAYIILSRRERKIWRELAFSEDRRTQWLLARMAAKDAVRLLVKEQFDTELWPADIDILEDEYGRSVASGKWVATIGKAPVVSMAFARDTAVALAAEGNQDLRVGIDIKNLHQPDGKTEKQTFSPGERKLFSAIAGSDQTEWVLRVQCAKAALAQALGRNVFAEPENLTVVELNPDSGMVTLEISDRFAQASARHQRNRWPIYTINDNGLICACIKLRIGGRGEK